MQTYEFRFLKRSALEQAFSAALSCESVVDCVVIAGDLRLRFRALPGSAGQQLFEQIHLRGDIVEANVIDLPPEASPWRESNPGRSGG